MEPDTELDLESAISAADLGLNEQPQEEEIVEDEPLEAAEETPVEDVPRETIAPETTEMPKSWKKEWEADWKATPKSAQDKFLEREKQMLQGLEQYKEHNEFGRTIKDVVKPYENYLQTQGVDSVKAVQYLLSAQYRLSTGDYQTKIQMLHELAKGVGVDLGQIGGQNTQNDPNNELNPLLNDIKGIKSELQAWKEANTNQVRQKVAQDVTAFASDPAHPYFDEVADDIARMIQMGADLGTAYEKAVWANPVTRAKELARIQTESVAKLKPKLAAEAQVARKATSTNVRSRDTGRTPTEPLGTMEDTMRETLAAMRARTH